MGEQFKIQGLTWFVMAATCIGMYYGPAPEKYKTFNGTLIDNTTRYIDLISFSFYDTLLYKENNRDHRVLKPQNFHVFAWAYAILSALWLGLAVSECVALFRRKTSKFETHVIMLSGFIIILTCIFDIILMSLAFNDYFQIHVFEYDVFDWDTTTIATTIEADSKLDNFLNEIPLSAVDKTGTKEVFQENIDLILRYRIGRKLSYGILITMCFRGFIIWIFNLVSGAILLTISLKIFQSPPILKYDNRSIPRPKIASTPSKDKESLFGSTFAEDTDHYTTPPSQSKRYSLPPVGYRYDRDPGRNNPFALSSRNGKNENMFF